MRLVRASLARRGTENCPERIREDVPLGALYTVDLDTTRDCTYHDALANKFHTFKIAIARDDAKGNYGFFNLALLDLDEGLISLDEHIALTEKAS